MRYVPLFLASLLLLEALVLPASASLMALYLPFRTAALVYKSFRFMRRANMVWRKMAITQRVLRLMLNRQDKLWGHSVLGLAKDSCFHRLLCEVNGEQHGGKRTGLWSKLKLAGDKFLNPESRLAITLSLVPPFFTATSDDSCERRYKTCPYSSRDMLQAFKKLGRVWNQLKLPPTVSARADQMDDDRSSQ